VHFLIGPLIAGFNLAVPALRDLAFAPLGLAGLVIGLIWPTRTLRVMAVSAALVLALASPASAQIDPQLVDWCDANDNASPEQSISGCTAVIQSEEYAGDDLAIVFSNRGVAYFRNSEPEKAIQDYEQAIRINPSFFDAMISRGFAYLKVKRYDAAIADFDTTLKAHPENAPSLYGRGLANLAKGDAAGASADMTAARRLDPAIGEELAVWGFNLDPPPESVPLPLAAAPGVTSSLSQSTASSAPAQETASLPPAAAPVPPPTPQNELNTTPPPPTQETASLPLPAEVAEALIKRGDELLGTGDIVAARLVYERAAAGGDRAAATGVAKTYDPTFLTQVGVRGLRADPARAALWYGRAAAAGDREAQQRLKRLRAQFPQ
jgi:tetratricopeptide (TPR) repeat protein